MSNIEGKKVREGASVADALAELVDGLTLDTRYLADLDDCFDADALVVLSPSEALELVGGVS